MMPAWARTIRFQVALSLGLMFAALAGSAGYGLYALNLRQHDYEILNLSGQLRVTSAAMISDARTHLQDPGSSAPGSARERAMYVERLRRHMALYDQIISSFVARRLDPELTGRSDALVCKWDSQSRSQLQRSSDDWRLFRAELVRRLGTGDQGPQAAAAAAYLVDNGDRLARSSSDLSRAFQLMMERKLSTLRLFDEVVLVAAAVTMLSLLALLYRRMVKPLRDTLSGFSRVARGDLGHQVPVQGAGEIRQMTTAFNQLSERLNSLFRLTDRITHGNTLDETLRFVLEEFRAFLPLDWVGVFFPSPDGERLVLERQYGDHGTALREGVSLPRSAVDLNPDAPATIDDIAARDAQAPSGACAAMLSEAGLGSAMLLRTQGDGTGALLVFASRTPRAYLPEHAELLTNVAGQVTHALDKTVFMEGLVVSAVQGLAKLAESRDPETGDHLARIALYAALLAEELGRSGPYAGDITAAYVRAIHQFAPMHDIGKVGLGDDILRKPGPLTAAERLEMQRHPVIGAEVLRRCEAQVNARGYSIFGMAIDIAEGHHERFDGTGYPARRSGKAIPLAARIVAVADVFDALTSRRPYKDAWPVDKALATLESLSGQHLDPDVLAAFFRALPRILDVHDRFKANAVDRVAASAATAEAVPETAAQLSTASA